MQKDRKTGQESAGSTLMRRANATAIGIAVGMSMFAGSDALTTASLMRDIPAKTGSKIPLRAPASEFNPQEFVEFSKHVESGIAMTRMHPKIIADLLAESKEHDPSKSTNSIIHTGIKYSNFKKSDLLDMLSIQGFWAENLGGLTPFISKFQDETAAAYQGMEPERASFYSSMAMLRDPEYLGVLKGVFKIDKVDPKSRSATYMADYIRRMVDLDQPFAIELVMGFAFEKTYAPLGTRHQWVEIKESNIDPSFSFDFTVNPKEVKYVPVIGFRVVMGKDGKLNAYKTIYCYPEELEISEPKK